MACKIDPQGLSTRCVAGVDGRFHRVNDRGPNRGRNESGKCLVLRPQERRVPRWRDHLATPVLRGQGPPHPRRWRSQSGWFLCKQLAIDPLFDARAWRDWLHPVPVWSTFMPENDRNPPKARALCNESRQAEAEKTGVNEDFVTDRARSSAQTGAPIGPAETGPDRPFGTARAECGSFRRCGPTVG